MTYAASPAISSVKKTIVVMQNKALLIAQQEEHIVNLIGSLVAMFSIDSTDGPMDGYFVNGGMRIAYADIVAHTRTRARGQRSYWRRWAITRN